jgi:hypothetical protein
VILEHGIQFYRKESHGSNVTQKLKKNNTLKIFSTIIHVYTRRYNFPLEELIQGKVIVE